ncbi:MAG: hypothetical protein A3I66_10965 [Burkholderiales bacterium RIFCSPLOWO2_02_FULL_57_36]|nr:MAG: hypothetical protein A3I66_10965 [Burkholderiales bacterium RIFCSPLOWO2_02_FULL_57_36]
MCALAYRKEELLSISLFRSRSGFSPNRQLKRIGNCADEPVDGPESARFDDHVTAFIPTEKDLP